MWKKVTVNENCIGCGACIAICPDVFAFSDEWVAFVNWDISCDEWSCVDDAQASCPVDAIQCIEK